MRTNLRFLANFLGTFITVCPPSPQLFLLCIRFVIPPHSLLIATQGNGVQAAFEDDPNVLYISIHRYENAAFYPNDTSGSYSSKGKGRGLGLCVLFCSGHPVRSGSFGAFGMSCDSSLTTRLFSLSARLTSLGPRAGKVTKTTFTRLRRW